MATNSPSTIRLFPRLAPATSHSPGVRRHRRKFLARVWRGGRYRLLGLFDSEHAAARARADWLALNPPPPARPPGQAGARFRVLDLLARVAPLRVTAAELRAVLERQGRRYSLGYLHRVLARLHTLGLVTNEWDGRGYGIPPARAA